MSFTSTHISLPILLLIFSIMAPSYASARILLDVADPPQAFHHPTQPSLTFIMQDKLPRPPIVNPQQGPFPPFSKPLGANNFPRTFKGSPLTYQTNSNFNLFPTQTLDHMPRFGIAFPTPSTLQQELEFGSITNIEEEIYLQNSALETILVGKAKGIYVAMGSSQDEDKHHMIAMTTTLGLENGDDDEMDSLKLFGVHRRDVSECHVAVIGGTGKFKDANGYAVISAASRYKDSSEEEANTMLLYNVFLS